jgi:HK97 family phage major capsid protein
MAILDPQIIPTTISREIIKAASQASVVLKLARTQPMPTSTMTLPVLKTLPNSGWVSGAAAGRKPATTIEWSAEKITAEELAAVIAVPDALIADAGVAIWTETRQALVDAMAYAIDSAILFGTNAPPTFLTDGVAGAAIAAGNTAHTPGVDEDLAHAVNLAMGDVEAAGLTPNGHAADVSIRSALRGMRSVDGLPLFVPNLSAEAYSTLYGLPIEFSGNGAFDTSVADLITGDWTKLIVGIRQDLRVDTSNQAVITDAAGKVLVNAFQDDQTIMRVYMRLGYVVGKPVTPTSGAGGAFPFALVDSATGPGAFAARTAATEEPTGGNGGTKTKSA